MLTGDAQGSNYDLSGRNFQVVEITTTTIASGKFSPSDVQLILEKMTIAD